MALKLYAVKVNQARFLPHSAKRQKEEHIMAKNQIVHGLSSYYAFMQVRFAGRYYRTLNGKCTGLAE